MMEFETWNRETLINEVKTAMTLVRFQAFGSFMGLPIQAKILSDKELHERTDFDLRNLYIDLKRHDRDFRKKYEENEEKKRFFNHPTSDADVDYWSKHAYWTIDEAIALLLGKDPRKVTWENVKTHLAKSPFAMKFNEIRELTRRYVNCKELFDTVYPGVFLAWAKRMNLEIPDNLIDAVTKIGVQIADWKGGYEQAMKRVEQANSLYDNAMELNKDKDKIIEIHKLRIAQLESSQIAKPEDTQPVKETERQSLYKLVATMAYVGYAYNPEDKKSAIPTELSNDGTRTIGEKIDRDTTLKWLKKAAERYPNITSKKTE